MNVNGKEFRVRKIWCNKHHFNDHYIFFIKRDYEKKQKAMLPYVLYSKVCVLCYNEDLELKKKQAVALGYKFDINRYAFDAPIEHLSEGDFQALWSTNFY